MGAARADDAEGDAMHHTGSVSHIGNKHKRQDMYQKYRKEKAKRKLARRLKTAKDERAGKDGKALKKVGVRNSHAGATRKKQAAHDREYARVQSDASPCAEYTRDALVDRGATAASTRTVRG